MGPKEGTKRTSHVIFERLESKSFSNHKSIKNQQRTTASDPTELVAGR